MKQTKPKVSPSFLAKNKDILVIGGVIVVLAGAATAYYFITKKKEKKEAADIRLNSGAMSSSTAGSSTVLSTPPFVPVNTGGSASITKPTITKSGYPIQMGSRHPDVKILQGYLKIYKEDLGRSGPKRDGVDGIFGPKTLRAAQKRLKKTVFIQSDIIGMRKALNSLGK